jgi:hypothetical protein
MTGTTWASNYKTKSPQTYSAIVGSVQAIDPTVVKFVEKASGRIGSCGFKQALGSVIFTSNSERDIHDIFKNQCWQNGNRPKGLKSGMSVFVIPNKSVRKDNENAVGVKFTLG